MLALKLCKQYLNLLNSFCLCKSPLFLIFPLENCENLELLVHQLDQLKNTLKIGKSNWTNNLIKMSYFLNKGNCILLLKSMYHLPCFLNTKLGGWEAEEQVKYKHSKHKISQSEIKLRKAKHIENASICTYPINF